MCYYQQIWKDNFAVKLLQNVWNCASNLLGFGKQKGTSSHLEADLPLKTAVSDNEEEPLYASALAESMQY